MYFEVNNVVDLQRIPCILTLMGSQMYALLRSISVPRKPKELSFTVIVNTLTKKTAERFKFHKRRKKRRNLFDSTWSSYGG